MSVGNRRQRASRTGSSTADRIPPHTHTCPLRKETLLTATEEKKQCHTGLVQRNRAFFSWKRFIIQSNDFLEVRDGSLDIHLDAVGQREVTVVQIAGVRLQLIEHELHSRQYRSLLQWTVYLLPDSTHGFVGESAGAGFCLGRVRTMLSTYN